MALIQPVVNPEKEDAFSNWVKLGQLFESAKKLQADDTGLIGLSPSEREHLLKSLDEFISRAYDKAGVEDIKKQETA